MKRHSAHQRRWQAVPVATGEPPYRWLLGASGDRGLRLARYPSALLVVTTALLVLGTLLVSASAGRLHAATPDPAISQMIGLVDTTTLLDYVAELSGERPALVGGEEYVFDTRYSYSEDITKATQYLAEHYGSLGLNVAYHEYTYEGHLWRNVEATLPGMTRPGRVYIICAHADSTSRHPLTDAPGADDNASGTAAVMIAADVLSTRQYEHTIRFVNFTGEEQGLQGSAAYAARARALGEDIAGVINLDMVGWDAVGGPDADLHAGTDPLSISLAHVFSETIDTYELPLWPEILDDEAIRASDHGSFWSEGYPAILAIEDHYPGLEDFNPYYHTDQDLLKHINPDYFTAFGRAVVATMVHLAVLVDVPPATVTATPTRPLVEHDQLFLPVVLYLAR